MRYRQRLCCVLVSSNLRLHLAAFCVRLLLQSLLTGGDKKIPRYQFFLALKLSYRYGFLRIRKITLGVSPWKKNCRETLPYIISERMLYKTERINTLCAYFLQMQMLPHRKHCRK